MEDKVLLAFLDKAEERAFKEIMEKGVLSVENAIPILLKNQFNHILHLDSEITEIKANMATKEDIETLKEDIKTFKEDIKKVEKKYDKLCRIIGIFGIIISTILTIGLTVISILVAKGNF